MRRTRANERSFARVLAPGCQPARNSGGRRTDGSIDLDLAEQPLSIRAAEADLERALARARALGATVHLDGTPGCGHQALVLFPA